MNDLLAAVTLIVILIGLCFLGVIVLAVVIGLTAA